MDTEEFSQSLMSKWATHRGTIARIWEQADPQIIVVNKHLMDLADILHDAIKMEIIFSTGERTYEAGIEHIRERVSLDCEDLGLNWKSDIYFGGRRSYI